VLSRMNSNVKVITAEQQVLASCARTVVLHYHLFKNAGTSIDSSFKDSLEEGEWTTREFSGTHNKKRKELLEWIDGNPEVKCFSSHTAALPPPEIDDVNILPIVFLRHPLDRIASAYAFEVKQQASTFGSVLARNTSLAGYIETRLSIPNDFQCRNFHAQKLAEMYPENTGSIEQRAVKAVYELPFIGIVEEFDKSIEALQSLVNVTSLRGIDIKVTRKNVSQDSQFSLSKKLDALKIRIGDDMYDELERVNSLDLKLFKKVKSIYTS
jgi:hypothetical protein